MAQDPNKRQVIYKYQLCWRHGPQRIGIPRGATVLAVQVQKDVPCIWALVDLDVPANDNNRVFEIVPTGKGPCASLNDSAVSYSYIGTFQLNDYVGHVFEHIQ